MQIGNLLRECSKLRSLIDSAAFTSIKHALNDEVVATNNVQKRIFTNFKTVGHRNVRRILVSGVNAPLPPEAKKIRKI